MHYACAAVIWLTDSRLLMVAIKLKHFVWTPLLLWGLLFGPVTAVAEEEIVPIKEYLPLGKEPFNINLSGRGDHVMVLVAQVYVTSERAKQGVTLHMPKIRNDLLGVLSKQRYKPMKKRKTKRRLRKKMVQVIRDTLQLRELPGADEVQEVVITRLLLQ